MTTKLAQELRALSPDVAERLAAHHFDAAQLSSFAARVADAGAMDNRVKGQLSPPGPADLVEMPARSTPEYERLRDIGLASLKRGENALIVLAGGMATRMGGVVKALVQALPGRTFLDLR